MSKLRQSNVLNPRVGYTTKIEEIDLHVLDHHVQLIRHAADLPHVPVPQNTHHAISVTLKDGTAWIVDPAGTQNGQQEPVLSLSQYNAVFAADITARRPYGHTWLRSGKSFTFERHPRNLDHLAVDLQLHNNLEYVLDELHEWQFKHVSVEALIKANVSDYQRFKGMLVTHLATAAREFTKRTKGDPTSTAKPINLDTAPELLSNENRMRLERKRDRKNALKRLLWKIGHEGPEGQED